MNEVLKILVESGTMAKKEIERIDFASTLSLVDFLIKRKSIERKDRILAAQIINDMHAAEYEDRDTLQFRSELVRLLMKGISRSIDRTTREFEKTRRSITSGEWPIIKIEES